MDGEGDVAVFLKLGKQLRHEHGVLAAGDADPDAVALVDEPIVLDRAGKARPEAMAELFLDAVVDPLAQSGVVLAAHRLHEPGKIPALQIPRVVALFAHLGCGAFADRAVFAIDDEYFSIVRRQRFPQFVK